MSQNLDRLIFLIEVVLFWLVVHAYVPALSLRFSDETMKKFANILRLRSFERNGKIYETLFLIRKWKKYLPDGAKWFKTAFKKKHLDSSDPAYLELFILESYRAEVTHWLIILHVLLFLCLADKSVFFIMLLYISLENLPCIIAQRYNRPRFVKVLKLKERRTQST